MKKFVVSALMSCLLTVSAFGQSKVESKFSGIPSLVRYGAGKIAFYDGIIIRGLFSIETDRTNYTSMYAEYGKLPVFSRDGSKLLMSYLGNIYLADSRGLDRVLLAPAGLPSEIAGDISPDNSKVILTHDGIGWQKIYQVNSDGTNMTTLTTGVFADTMPRYSPDGSKIVFARKFAVEQSICVMNADGTNIVRLTNTTGVWDEAPSFSNDGSKIVFNRRLNLGSGESPIMMMNADGSNPVVVRNGYNYYASFSPDDRSLLYLDNNPSTFWSNIQIRNLETGEDRFVTSVGDSIDRPSWQTYIIKKNVPFDFDGDRKADISIYRNVSGKGSWMLSRSATGTFYANQFGLPTDVLVPGDYDGDGKTDYAVFRPSDGTWYRTNSVTGSFYGVNFGTQGDIPVPADYDGDDKTDIAVYRPSAGNWYRLNSSDGQFVSFHFGIAEDKPLIGDFDGDNKTDFAVFRPSTANWYILRSSNNQLIAVSFGISTDKIVPADYDGDGKTDIAVFRDGIWYRLNSSDNSFFAFAFGSAEDKPVAADYDGDGKTDIGVFRQSNGYWYLYGSTSGTIVKHFGANGDAALPSAFVK